MSNAQSTSNEGEGDVAMHPSGMTRQRLALLLAGMAAVLVLAAGCTANTGTVRVHTSHTVANEQLTVKLLDSTGHAVRTASGPGAGWDAQFTDVPPGTYRVLLAITEPSTTGPGGTTIGTTIVTQAPGSIGVGAGTTTVLTYDGTSWTAVQ